MKARTKLLALAAVVAAVALGLAIETTAGTNEKKKAFAVLHDDRGNEIGRVALRQGKNGGVAVRVTAARLPAGFHGFHVHAVGVCEPPFTSAGGHLNPTAAGHGAHAGDMPPLLVTADGRARAEFLTDRFSIADLLDADGSAIVVHAGADNLANIPSRYHSHLPDASSTTFGPDAMTLATGDAGARLACGTVTRRAKGR